MDENYCALALSILKNCTPEQAFQILDTGKFETKELRKNESYEMIEFRKQGFTYKEIGEMFCISKDAVYTRIRRITGRI